MTICHTMEIVINTLLMKWQFVVTHKTHQTEIHTLLDSWVTNATFVKKLGP